MLDILARGGRHQQYINGGLSDTLSQTFGYDLLGNVNLLGYPSCPAAPARNQSFGYTNGWLTSIPGLTSGAASPMTYHSTGMVAQLIRSNNVRDTWTNDPTGTPGRPQSRRRRRAEPCCGTAGRWAMTARATSSAAATPGTNTIR